MPTSYDVGRGCLIEPAHGIQALFHAYWATMCPCSFAKQREEPLGPAVEGAPVHDEASLSEPLDNVGIAQAVANIPADRQGDHVVGEGMLREGAR